MYFLVFHFVENVCVGWPTAEMLTILMFIAVGLFILLVTDLNMHVSNTLFILFMTK